MGRIQSSIGLITGTDIVGTVDQLIAISGQPRDRLVSRTNTLLEEQKALAELTAAVIGVQLAGARLSSRSVFRSTDVVSSNPDALSATAGSNAEPGRYVVNTIKTAATHAVDSLRRFQSFDQALGLTGSIDISPDGFIDDSLDLQNVNNGRGVQPGVIRITDRSGRSSQIDLSTARTIDDVLTAINDAEIDVLATTVGGAIQLVDQTGQTTSNLVVEQLGDAETAADLGLWGIDVASDVATGLELTFDVSASTPLSDLRQGEGIRFTNGDDIAITLSDGSTLNVDFAAFSNTSSPPTGTTNPSTNPDAGLVFTDATANQDFEGLQVSFVNNPLLLPGAESFTLSGSGASQSLVFEINETFTTAATIANLVNSDPQLSAQLQAATVDASGNPSAGTGNVSSNDSATLASTSSGPAITDPTLQDVVDYLNQVDPAKLSAVFNDDGLVVTDLTGGTGSFAIADAANSTTASDLGLTQPAVGATITAPFETPVLRGVSLDSVAGGAGLPNLTSLQITLSDGSSATVDVSAATTTSEVLDAINAAGLPLIARLNDARTGYRLRDVSGGTGNFSITSADATAASLGIEFDTDEDIVVGGNVRVQTVDRNTLLADLNQGDGVTGGSFTIIDSAGNQSAVNITVDGLKSVGALIDRINNLGIGVTASINDNGDGIAIVDTAGGSQTLTIADTGSGTAAAKLGIAGDATVQDVGGNPVLAIVGSQSGRIEITAEDSLADIVAKINESGRYGEATIRQNDDGSFSLSVRSQRGGEAGRFAINTEGFDLGLRTSSRGQDALISVSTGEGVSRFLTSSDGVFDLSELKSGSATISTSTPLSDLNRGAGIGLGSFTITDSKGVTSAVNLRVEQITTVGGVIDAINALGIGVTASINEETGGIAVVDTAGGGEKLTISDVGNSTSAADLGIAGTATTQTVDGFSVSALVGPAADDSGLDDTGLVLTLKELSESPITVTVDEDPDAVVEAAQSFVDQFNGLVEKLDSLTFFDAETDEVGLLFGSSEALRIENGYSRLLSGVITGAGNIRSVGQVGLRFNDQGKLDLDSGKLSEALSENAADVEAFFATNESGLANRLDALAERIAGETGSLLINRTESLSTQIRRNNERVESLNERLDNERERLLKQFYATEEAIAKIQSNQQYISQIQPVSVPTN